MTREYIPVDIGDAPDLVRLAEEVRRSNRSRLLRRNGEDIALLAPVRPSSKRRPKPARGGAAYEAFRSAAGGWSEVDTEKLLTEIYADRDDADRPPVEL